MKLMTDYHIHTDASFDCFSSALDQAKAAAAQGVTHLAFTDHLDCLPDRPFDWQTDFALAKKEAESARTVFERPHTLCNTDFSTKCNNDVLIKNPKPLNSISTARDLDIAFGVEIGQPQFNPSEAQRFIEIYRPDFVIGSIHYLDPSFDIGLSDVTVKDPRDLYLRYLMMVSELASDYDYDVLGHLTYPWRYYKRQLNYDFYAIDYRDQFLEIFDIVISRGKGLEVNTSGKRQALDDFLPNSEILSWYLKCGGEVITVGSDSHTPEHVGLDVAEAHDLLREIGFESVSTYRNRCRTAHTL